VNKQTQNEGSRKGGSSQHCSAAAARVYFQ